MRQVRFIMGMPVIVEIRDSSVTPDIFNWVFTYFTYVDDKFSTYKPTSEISLINQSKINTYSQDMQEILSLSRETKAVTHGYFDISRGGHLDPSGIVKGWAIKKAADIVKQAGFTDYYVDAGGDVQVSGHPWKIGIRNPFNVHENVKIISVADRGVATSGSYERGEHIYNPVDSYVPGSEIVSMTVIGPDIYEADRFATAAYAMGPTGIGFINSLKDFDAYQIDRSGRALFTPGFDRYVVSN